MVYFLKRKNLLFPTANCSTNCRCSLGLYSWIAFGHSNQIQKKRRIPKMHIRRVEKILPLKRKPGSLLETVPIACCFAWRPQGLAAAASSWQQPFGASGNRSSVGTKPLANGTLHTPLVTILLQELRNNQEQHFISHSISRWFSNSSSTANNCRKMLF